MGGSSPRCCWALAARAQWHAQETGSIVGRVADLGGAPYVGAEVTVTDLGYEGGHRRAGALPDSRRRRRQPSGPGRLPVGRDGDRDRRGRGRRARWSSTSSSSRTPKRSTSSRRRYLQGEAAALNQQKNAVNITNIVSADQIGRFPDPNAAEATQRVPAITLQRDQGEGRYVIIRGTEPRLELDHRRRRAHPVARGRRPRHRARRHSRRPAAVDRSLEGAHPRHGRRRHRRLRQPGHQARARASSGSPRRSPAATTSSPKTRS